MQQCHMPILHADPHILVSTLVGPNKGAGLGLVLVFFSNGSAALQ